MMRMLRVGRFLRWGYLAPRLIALAALVCLSEIGAGPIAGWLITTAGESTIGAAVDIESSEASLLGGRLSLGDVQVANPDDPTRNLFEADAVLVDFDTKALLHKRAEVTRGVVRGLRIGAGRVVSGELEEPAEREPGPAAKWITDTAAGRAEDWLSGVGDRVTEDLTGELVTPGLAKQLREEWPAKYQQIADDAAKLKANYQALKTEAKSASKNPLRHATFLRELPQRLADIEKQLRDLHAEFDALPDKLAEDRERIAAARVHDQQTLRGKLSVAELDAEALTAYLLGEQFAGPMDELIGWLRWARSMAPTKVDTPEAAERSRGVDVLFAGVPLRPDVLINVLELTGETRLGGRPVALSGRITDVTSHPARHGKPMLLELAADGAAPLRLRATIDRTTGAARDELVATLNGFALPGMELGKGKKFGLDVSPSTASINVSLILNGDELSGDVQMVQQEFSATPTGDSNSVLAGAAREALAANLRRLPKIASRIDLGGTLDKPELRLWSNLGPAVASAMESAAQKALEQQADRLLAKSQQAVDAELAKLD
ncbi:MAG: TIGR03545 family protein, partial [Planctomycetota bacterium]